MLLFYPDLALCSPIVMRACSPDLACTSRCLVLPGSLRAPSRDLVVRFAVSCSPDRCVPVAGSCRALRGSRGLAVRMHYPARVRVQVSEEAVEVLLSRWEKVLGLLGDITVPRADVSEVRVVEEPMREVLRTGMKAGLRLPWLYYVARTIRLDEAWLVRRGVPALSFAVRNQGALRRVVVSTREAELLARELTAGQ